MNGCLFSYHLFNPQPFLKYILNSCYMLYTVRGTVVINMDILLAFRELSERGLGVGDKHQRNNKYV